MNDLYSAFTESAAIHPQGDAIVFEGERISYARLLRRIDDVAMMLVSLGVQAGDRVGFLGGNRPEYVELLFACARTGASLVPINTRYGESDLAGAIRRCAPRVIFHASTFKTQNLSGLLAGALNSSVQDFSASPEIPELKRLVPFDGNAAGSYSKLVAAVPEGQPNELSPADRANAVGVLLFTSGSSGAPKPVMLGQKEIVSNMRGLIDRQKLVPGDRYLSFLPFFHIFGGIIGTVTPLISGGTIVMMDSFDAGASLGLASKERCSVVFGVAPTYQSWFEHPDFSSTDISTLRTGICNAGKGPMARMTKRVRAELALTHSVFAMTETCGAPTCTDGSEAETVATESAGRALPGFEIGIFRPGSSIREEAGALGEIRIRSKLLSRGYFRMPDETARAYTEGWFRTGDRGFMDADGYLFVDGRLDDRLRSGGENIDPKEVEDFIERLPGVRKCHVVGVPDPRLHEVPVAFVIPLAAGPVPCEAELIALCKGKIANFKVPRRVFIISEAPGWMHKVQKHRLKEDAISRMATDKQEPAL